MKDTMTIDPRAITAAEAAAHDRSSRCPKCGEWGDYEGSEFGDDAVWQDADCPNGHAWREISTLTHIVAITEKNGEEIGAPVEYPRPNAQAIDDLITAARLALVALDIAASGNTEADTVAEVAHHPSLALYAALRPFTPEVKA